MTTNLIEERHTKTVKIFINSRPHKWAKVEISFEQLVQIAFPNGTGDNPHITVTYRRGNGNRDGSLIAGQSVKVKEGMAFNVDVTNRS